MFIFSSIVLIKLINFILILWEFVQCVSIIFSLFPKSPPTSFTIHTTLCSLFRNLSRTSAGAWPFQKGKEEEWMGWSGRRDGQGRREGKLWSKCNNIWEKNKKPIKINLCCPRAPMYGAFHWTVAAYQRLSS